MNSRIIQPLRTMRLKKNKMMDLNMNANLNPAPFGIAAQTPKVIGTVPGALQKTNGRLGKSKTPQNRFSNSTTAN